MLCLVCHNELVSLITVGVELPECVTSSTRLLAYDAIVYKEIKSQSDTLELQKDLIALEEWEKTWGMSFHPEQCNIIVSFLISV
jgi:hypothetical protein